MANSELDALNQPNDRKPNRIPKYVINRDVLTHETVIQNTGYIARDKSISAYFRSFCKECSLLQTIINFIPILKWLPKYSFSKNLSGDIIAGFTVGVMHIPQGMAYGLLAGVTPNVGLYMAFFPVLMYMVLGTSRHISIGTFAVISLMTLKVVQTHATLESDDSNPDEIVYTPMEVVTATAVAVGIINLIMFIFRLGFLASLLSAPIVNGFTTAAAIHVVVTQLKDIFGVSVPRRKGAFKIAYGLYDIFASLPKANVSTIIFSCGVILFMVLMNELIKPWLSKKCRFPLPAELLCIVGGNLISKYIESDNAYQIKLIGNIPTGLPGPSFPPINLIGMVFTDAIAIAVVSFSVIISMGLTFAKKHSYEISANQELFAMGISNIFGGCFSCIPLACSLSRSIIQEQTGGITQIASLISSLLILTVLLWIGPFFATLPKCVLAGIIIVALKKMFTQVAELKIFARQGKLEVFNWLVTFLGVVILDIDIGLLIGILFSLLTFYIKGFKPYGSLLGTMTNAQSGIYVDIDNHKNAIELLQMKIYRYCGAINFACSFKQQLYKEISVDYGKIRRASIGVSSKLPGEELNNLIAYDTLILDLSCCSHLDMAGCTVLTEIAKEIKILSVRLFIAAPSDRVYDTLVQSMTMGEGPFDIFPTLHDAVLYAEACRTA